METDCENPPAPGRLAVAAWFCRLVAFLLAGAGCTAMARQPNIVLIVADDMGYSDAGCYGGEIATPSLDRLAGEGLRLARFQNCGMCVVTRTSLMTGKWWPRALPEFRRSSLLSEKLRDLGYRCGLIGKWHLDGDPMDRGFDHFFGFKGGFSDHFAGGGDYRLDRGPAGALGAGYYSSDAFAERAVSFIERPSDKPFFLFLSYQAPHNPLQAPRETIAKYRGRYLHGWQAVREERFRRQKESGLFPKSLELPPYPANLPEWKSLDAAQRDLEDLRMAVYAAMIERMDHGIGRVMESLARKGVEENTLVLFMSDNGVDPFPTVDEAMLRQGKLPGDPQSNWQPGTGWAYAGVTPWRLYKISQHGGGITTGAIVRWPERMRRGLAGGISHARVHVVDLMPTLLEAASAVAPIDALAGRSFLPLFRGMDWPREEPLFFQYMDNRAIRTAEWTLAEADGGGWELFDAAEDPLETRDLFKTRPETAAKLAGQWLDWWTAQSGKPGYTPVSTAAGPHYRPQGDRGSGRIYQPSAMPAGLSGRFPVPGR